MRKSIVMGIVGVAAVTAGNNNIIIGTLGSMQVTITISRAVAMSKWASMPSSTALTTGLSATNMWSSATE